MELFWRPALATARKQPFSYFRTGVWGDCLGRERAESQPRVLPRIFLPYSSDKASVQPGGQLVTRGGNVVGNESVEVFPNRIADLGVGKHLECQSCQAILMGLAHRISPAFDADVLLHQQFALGAACAWGGAQVTGRTRAQFTRTFTYHAFGDRTGRLAEALQLLGAWPGSQLYHALIEPFDPRKPMVGYRPIASGRLSAPALRRRLQVLRSLRFGAPKPRAAFEALALEEFRLARRMDLLACRRGLAGMRLLAGRSVPGPELRSIARDMDALMEDFSALWRRRNRPSRLRDNLAAMRAAAAEARGAARR